MENVAWLSCLLVIMAFLMTGDAVNIPQPQSTTTPNTLTPANPRSPVPPRLPARRNCSSESDKASKDMQAEVSIRLLPGAIRTSQAGTRYLPPRPDSTVDDDCAGTDDLDTTSEERVAPDRWKVHIIMACTVAAAVEIVLVIFIILYWRQIRWTLRKITCPCVNCRPGEHAAMEREAEGEGDAESDNSDSELVVTFESAGIQPVATNDNIRGSRSRSYLEGADGQPLPSTSADVAVVQKFVAPKKTWVHSAVDSDDDNDDGEASGVNYDVIGPGFSNIHPIKYGACPVSDKNDVDAKRSRWLSKPGAANADGETSRDESDVVVSRDNGAPSRGYDVTVTSPQKQRGKTKCLHKGKKSVCDECAAWYTMDSNSGVTPLPLSLSLSRGSDSAINTPPHTRGDEPTNPSTRSDDADHEPDPMQQTMPEYGSCDDNSQKNPYHFQSANSTEQASRGVDLDSIQIDKCRDDKQRCKGNLTDVQMKTPHTGAERDSVVSPNWELQSRDHQSGPSASAVRTVPVMTSRGHTGVTNPSESDYCVEIHQPPEEISPQ